MKILGTGLSGMVGSKLVELLQPEFEFQDLSLDTGVDICNQPQVFQSVVDSKAALILHLAAKADVAACEKDRILGEKSAAWQINVVGSHNVAAAAAKFSKKLVYVSTDFVFDGRKAGSYTESDRPNPLNYYGQTKYAGEKAVQEMAPDVLVIRIAYPYGSQNTLKKDFVRRFRDRFEQGQSVSGLDDHIFTPTLIADIALALKTLIAKNAVGIYHVTGAEQLTPYQALLAIAEQFQYDKSLVKRAKLEESLPTETPRPKNLSLTSEKLAGLGINMRTFTAGLKTL